MGRGRPSREACEEMCFFPLAARDRRSKRETGRKHCSIALQAVWDGLLLHPEVLHAGRVSSTRRKKKGENEDEPTTRRSW